MKLKSNTDELIENAELAFWDVIAKGVPEARSGDLDPGVSFELSRIIKKAVFWWIRFNVPRKSLEKYIEDIQPADRIYCEEA